MDQYINSAEGTKGSWQWTETQSKKVLKHQVYWTVERWQYDSLENTISIIKMRWKLRLTLWSFLTIVRTPWGETISWGETIHVTNTLNRTADTNKTYTRPWSWVDEEDSNAQLHTAAVCRFKITCKKRQKLDCIKLFEDPYRAKKEKKNKLSD